MTSDFDNSENRGLTTDQIAAAGSEPNPAEVPARAGRDGYDDAYDDTSARPDAGLAASGYPTPDAGASATAPETRASLLEEGELQNITARWKDIQAEFVDEPEHAVQEADALVAELMQRLAAMFATERADLEKRWAGGSQVNTEDLRQGLRRYRSFFERLLAA